MGSVQISNHSPHQITRCDERGKTTHHGNNLSTLEKKDAALREDIANALWKDDVLRALDYHEIDLRVKNEIVTLSGHILGQSSRSRIENAIRATAGGVEIKNDLILDDQLTLDVAAELGSLEQAYHCKFFTGASYGVVSINGTVRDENIRLLAEKCAAGNPNVRGVVNNIEVSGAGLKLKGQPFLQPIIGGTIYFLDWVSAVVKQVIINPNNRRVIAMIIQGNFIDQHSGLNSQKDDKARLAERLVIVRMEAVRHLTRISGFLYISSNERDQYMDFDPAYFIAPNEDWVPPYPYCPDDVLFTVKFPRAGEKMENSAGRTPSIPLTKEQAYSEELLANDSLGG